MKASLIIEMIGDNNYQYGIYANSMTSMATGERCDLFTIPKRSWCARIIGVHPKYRWEREFLKGMKDYSGSNSKGSRGITCTYILESWNVYEIKAAISWRSEERYFCFVDGHGEIKKISEDQVENFIRY